MGLNINPLVKTMSQSFKFVLKKGVEALEKSEEVLENVGESLSTKIMDQYNENLDGK